MKNIETWHFGDVVENQWASLDNPTRRGYFVRYIDRTGRLNPGRYAEITDSYGKFWECPVSDKLVRIAFSGITQTLPLKLGK